MSDITTALEESYRELCIRVQAFATGLRHRGAEERGQTAAEYMGILLVVAVIIAALIAADIDGKIATAAGEMIDKIKGGNENR
jgi:Flp pilus assembly pilin Flp